MNDTLSKPRADRRLPSETKRGRRLPLRGVRLIRQLLRSLLSPTRRLRRYGRFLGEFQRFRSQVPAGGSLPRWRDRHPCLFDRTAATGFDRHYVFHTSWAARKVAELRPVVHVDISSSLYFAGIVSAFVPVDFYDYRPAALALSNLRSERCDLGQLRFPDESVASLSCMHVVEHIGLGRYGDPLDPEGDRTAMAELSRVLAPGGQLLFVVPIGRPRICFNAHRIYSYRQIRDAFSAFELAEFALIPDRAEDGGLIRDAPEELCDGQSYGCGCFCFRRPATTERADR